METTSNKYSLRLTTRDRELLRLVAEAHQRRAGDAMRVLLRAEARRLGLLPPPEQTTASAQRSQLEAA